MASIRIHRDVMTRVTLNSAFIWSRVSRLTVVVLVFARLLRLGLDKKLALQPDLLFVLWRQIRRARETEGVTHPDPKLRSTPMAFVCTLTDGHFEEVGHVLQFSSDVGVMNGEEAFPSSPEHWGDNDTRSRTVLLHGRSVWIFQTPTSRTEIFCAQLLGDVEPLLHLSTSVGQNVTVRVGGCAVHVPVAAITGV